MPAQSLVLLWRLTKDVFRSINELLGGNKFSTLVALAAMGMAGTTTHFISETYMLRARLTVYTERVKVLEAGVLTWKDLHLGVVAVDAPKPPRGKVEEKPVALNPKRRTPNRESLESLKNAW